MEKFCAGSFVEGGKSSYSRFFSDDLQLFSLSLHYSSSIHRDIASTPKHRHDNNAGKCRFNRITGKTFKDKAVPRRYLHLLVERSGKDDIFIHIKRRIRLVQCCEGIARKEHKLLTHCIDLYAPLFSFAVLLRLRLCAPNKLLQCVFARTEIRSCDCIERDDNGDREQHGENCNRQKKFKECEAGSESERWHRVYSVTDEHHEIPFSSLLRVVLLHCSSPISLRCFRPPNRSA